MRVVFKTAIGNRNTKLNTRKAHRVQIDHHKAEFGGFFFFLLFRAAPKAYGGSQGRGQMGAAAAGLHHTTAA